MDELIQALQTYETEGSEANRDAVLSALQSKAHGVYQAVFDKGHRNATARLNDQKEALEGQVARLTSELETAQTRLEEATSNQPDVSAIHQQYKDEIKGLKEEHKDALDNLRAANVAEKREGAKARLKALLASDDFGVDSDYADLQVERAADRIRVTDEGGIEILQAGKDIPYSPGEGQDALSLLATEIRNGTPEKFVTVKADRGSNIGNGGAGGRAGSVYEQIRAKAEEARKGKNGNGLEEIQRRMGIPAT